MKGRNFALFSEVAERVELSVFDFVGNEVRVETDGDVDWHGSIFPYPLG